VSPLPVQMEDHWSLAPGVDPGRACLMWFMCVGDNPQAVELAQLGQRRLAGLAGLDLVPRDWLHMTTLIAGFADEISSGQAETMAARRAGCWQARHRSGSAWARSCTTHGPSCSLRSHPVLWNLCCRRSKRPRASLRDAKASCITSHGLRTSRSPTPIPHARRAR
jgi:hypothetical protein